MALRTDSSQGVPREKIPDTAKMSPATNAAIRWHKSTHDVID